MPGVEGFNQLEAQPVAPTNAVETVDVLADDIGEGTKAEAMSILSKIEG